MGQDIGWGLVNILPVDLPALSGAEVPQGQELCRWVLVLIRSADSGVEGDFHGSLARSKLVLERLSGASA